MSSSANQCSNQEETNSNVLYELEPNDASDMTPLQSSSDINSLQATSDNGNDEDISTTFQPSPPPAEQLSAPPTEQQQPQDIIPSEPSIHSERLTATRNFQTVAFEVNIFNCYYKYQYIYIILTFRFAISRPKYFPLLSEARIFE